MFRVVSVLLVALVFGCSTIGGSEIVPILSVFPYPCIGLHVEKALSDEAVAKIRTAHEKWLINAKDPEGQKANLCKAKVLNGKFQKADLKLADFQMAMLVRSNFTSAQLSEAEFQGANLSGANFGDAQLAGAHFDDAMLHLAIFQKTTFGKKTSLRRAMLYKTQFKGVDLTEVEGLTQSQIHMACLDGQTKLPRGLKRPKPC